MTGIAIIGAGGFAREVLWLVRESAAGGAQIEPWGFIDDNPELHGRVLCDLPVRGGLEALAAVKDSVHAVCAIGSPTAKRRVVERAEALGIRFATVIAPDVKRSRYLEIGEGGIVCAGNILTTQIKFGRHVILNLDCTVGHDVTIGDYTTIAPGVHISGNCAIGAGCDLGTGCALIQGISVGDGSIVGAGSVLIRDIPAHVTAVGAPAKVIKQHS